METKVDEIADGRPALTELEPRTLALMHGPAFTGDGAAMLHSLADAYEARLRERM